MPAHEDYGGTLLDIFPHRTNLRNKTELEKNKPFYSISTCRSQNCQNLSNQAKLDSTKMSSIDKLAIRGIRSFDNQSMAVMQFYSPLTVIVGYNGSGKTTIIECLKYITTGDLPPNTKGGAFVHDPSIAGESTVMAEVLLRFKNAAGTKLIASRRLQVTKKKNAGITMKTLEGTLSYHDDPSGGQSTKRKTISTKCAELDSEIPRHLGISKAILENVIFCHQEDSNWPLSEPASLKKKFDEIFEATKYTKALDNIKSIKKEATIELKVDKEKYNALVIDKNRAEKLQASIDKILSSIATKEQEYSKLEDKICELAESNKAFYEGAIRYKEILNEHSTLSSQKENKLKIVNDLLEDIEEVQDATDQELVERREQSKNKLASHSERLLQARSQSAALDAELVKLRRRHQNKLTEFGQLKAQAQRQIGALEERQEMIVTISKSHDIAGFDSMPIDQGRAIEFLNLLLDYQKRSTNDLDSTKRESKKAEEASQAEIYELKSQQSCIRQKKQAVLDRIDDTRKKIRNSSHRIEEVRISEADIKFQSDTLEGKRAQLSHLKHETAEAKSGETIKLKQQDIKNLEDQRDTCHAELLGLNRQFDTRAKVALKHTDAKKKQDGVQTLINVHGAKFQELVNLEMTAQTAERDINDAIRTTERKLSDAEVKRATTSKDFQTIDTKLQMNKLKLSNTRRELESLEEKINSQVQGQTVAASIAEAEAEIQSLLRDLDTMRFSVQFHENLLARAKKANQCGACQRAFRGDDEMVAFERYCKQTIAKLPKEKAKLEADLKEWQDQLEEMKELLPAEMSAAKLREKDLPDLQHEVGEFQSKASVALRKSEEARAEVEKLKDLLSELQLSKRSAVDISRMNQEIKELTKEAEELERELEDLGTTKTVEDVQDELDCLSLQLVESRKELENLINEREQKRVAIQNLEAQTHQVQLDLNSKRQQLKERAAFEAQKEESKEELVKLENELKATEELLKTFDVPITVKQEELKQIRMENTAKENRVVTQIQAYNKSVNQLETVNREIERFVQLGLEARIRRCQDDLNELDQQVKGTTEKMAAIQQMQTDIDKESAKAKAFERNISDNIRLRAYRSEIRQLEESLAELDVEGATRASRKYDEEYHKARKYQTDLQAEQAKLGGEIGMDKKNLKDKRSEMDTEFKNIIERHRGQLVKVKTVEIANQDLDKYAKALDQAIMKYHSHKMAEINDTIQTLWQKTYQGTDIDKILIKSENESTKSNRSYNYRVVMMKDQVEMDMRGRCSAGQKVLASIIIRLALAESFGTNCGILALDEPTTNLDRENINALSAALAEIIKERRDQANFQLVVITHDEDFLNQLGQSDVLDKYWRVSRNLQQKSIIERQRLV
ncbi:hypothetical protein O181_007165 [Austropuccinia psidii MF-1]|uniref:DNA repair protein RAD50 n=1 Tax=Austropuccinia psidii MF-1 TaxID=1389203 RepID=A0A9Q3BLU9_9BASI|nr:hypothetical protein [Austropuccinia psidii MF-1]